MALGIYGLWRRRMTYLLRLIACLFLCVSLNSFGAYYTKTDGTIINPIQYVSGGNHSFSGDNLEPNAQLSNANLSNANLSNANLSNANLTNANLSNANLYGAVLTHLSFANLSYAEMSNVNLVQSNMLRANLSYSNLTGSNMSLAALYLTDLSFTNLSNANLSNINYWNTVNFAGATYNSQTILPTNFDPVAAGMTFVPLPAGIYLFLSGLVGLALVKSKKKVSLN